MKTKNARTIILSIFSLAFLVLAFHETAFAEVKTSGVLDTVLEQYATAAKSWGEVIQSAASRLFWSLVAISMVWTFSQLLFHRSSFAELFGELVRFLIFTGFYFWLLTNGPKMADAIIKSMRKLGEQASNQPGLNPSDIVDVGFKIVDMAYDKISEWSLLSPITSLGCMLVSLAVLVILALVGINMLLQLCSAWVLAYAGIFFLGFGGSRWTSDMAINYFKTVLGLGASLMTMTLLVGIGTDIINEYHKKMSPDMNLQELSVLLVVALTLLLLVDKLPFLVSGIITGASIGSNAGGSYGAGAAMAATMAVAPTAKSVAFGGVAMAGRTALAGATKIAGMASAVNTAPQKAEKGDSGSGKASPLSRYRPLQKL